MSVIYTQPVQDSLTEQYLKEAGRNQEERKGNTGEWDGIQ